MTTKTTISNVVFCSSVSADWNCRIGDNYFGALHTRPQILHTPMKTQLNADPVKGFILFAVDLVTNRGLLPALEGAFEEMPVSVRNKRIERDLLEFYAKALYVGRIESPVPWFKKWPEETLVVVSYINAARICADGLDGEVLDALLGAVVPLADLFIEGFQSRFNIHNVLFRVT